MDTDWTDLLEPLNSKIRIVMSSCFETISIVYSDAEISDVKFIPTRKCKYRYVVLNHESVCLNIPNSSTQEHWLNKWCLTWDLCASGRQEERLRKPGFFAISVSKCKWVRNDTLHMYMVKSMFMELEQRELLNHLIKSKNERKKDNHWELFLRVWGSWTELTTDHHWCQTWSDANIYIFLYYLLLGYGPL